MTKPRIGIGCDIAQESGERARVFVYLPYVEAVRRAGGIPLLIPPQAENIAEAIEALDGVLLAGGDDCDPALYGETPHASVHPMDRRRQSNEQSLALVSRQRSIPALGICLGMQMMNVVAGGSLIQDIASLVKTTRDTEVDHTSPASDRQFHEISIERGTKLCAIVGTRELQVNSSHHQAIGAAGKGLRVTAHAADGIVEGIEDPDHPFYVGVQWHPEDMSGDPAAEALFRAFIEAAQAYASSKQQLSTLLVTTR